MMSDVVLVAIGAGVAALAFYKLYHRHATGSAKAAWWTIGVAATALVLWAGHNMVRLWLTSEL